MMDSRIELVSTAPIITPGEMRRLGAIPAIRGYVKGWFPDRRGNGIGEISYRHKGPIDLLDEIKNVDVYDTPKGILVGYVQLSDGTFVGITKERINKKALVAGGISAILVATTAAVIIKMDEEDKEEIMKEIRKLRKQLSK
jgi:hypothetical protein